MGEDRREGQIWRGGEGEFVLPSADPGSATMCAYYNN